jgi:hypothetical protein
MLDRDVILALVAHSAAARPSRIASRLVAGPRALTGLMRCVVACRYTSVTCGLRRIRSHQGRCEASDLGFFGDDHCDRLPLNKSCRRKAAGKAFLLAGDVSL